MLCRLLQGLCTGGEYNGSAIFALEHVGKRYPGFTGGLITGASVIGALLATSMGILCRQPWMPTWSWRLAFCLGGVVSLVGLYIRLYTKESPEFERIAYRKKAGTSYKSFFRFTANPRSISDRWSKFALEKSQVGPKILEAIEVHYGKLMVRN